MGRRDIRISRAGEIPPALVITKKYQDIGPGRLGMDSHKSQHHDKKQMSVHRLVLSWRRYPGH